MITSFEVGSIFKIIDEASPTLKRIQAQVASLHKAIDKAKQAMSGIANIPALGTAIGETQRLATAWGDVSKAASSANRAIGRATARSGALAAAGPSAVGEVNTLAGAYANLATQMAAARAAAGWRAGLPPSPGAGGGNAGIAGAVRGRRLAQGGGGGAHIGGPSLAIPGGSHVNFRGGAAAALGLTGYGAYEAAQMEDAVWQLIYHSGLDQNDANRASFRKILQDATSESGYSLHDVAESAKQEIRMFQGTPGGGIDVLPEMLRAATIESRLKGESPEESMKALVGLAHMTKQYDPEAIKKLAPAFAFLSTADPRSLSSIERAAGYAVPILQSSLEIDPMDALLEGTALARAGITNSKSGTWLREAATRAMPGTSMMSRMAFKKHEQGLRRLGLIDENGKPTWFGADGRPDLLKLQEIVGENAAKIPLAERAGIERQVFGAQGAGALAVLGDSSVNAQVRSLRSTRDSEEFKNRYGSFVNDYKAGSTVQNARTAIAEFNNTMMDIGQHVLPAVNVVLRNFKSILESIRDVLPKVPNAGATVGARAIEGAGVGAAIGALGGLGGVAGGTAIGGVLGAGAGAAELVLPPPNEAKDALASAFDKFRKEPERWTSPGKTGHPAQPIVVNPAPVTLNLNIDGRALAQAISEKLSDLYRFNTSAPAYDGLGGQ